MPMRLDAVPLGDEGVTFEHQQGLAARAHPVEQPHDAVLQHRVGEPDPGLRQGGLGFGESTATGGHRGHHGHPQQSREFRVVHLHTARRGLVDHVEGHHQGQPHVDQLQGQEEVALQVDGVDHVEHHVGVDDDVAGHDLLVVERRDPVDARSVEHDVVTHAPARDGHGGAGEVRDVNVETGERVEEEGLAYVGIAHQDDPAGAVRGLDRRRDRDTPRGRGPHRPIADRARLRRLRPAPTVRALRPHALRPRTSSPRSDFGPHSARPRAASSTTMRAARLRPRQISWLAWRTSTGPTRERLGPIDDGALTDAEADALRPGTIVGDLQDAHPASLPRLE